MLPKNASQKWVALLLSFLILIAGCKKTSSVTDNPGTPDMPAVVNDAATVAATVSGSVLDENNQPVANATVMADTYSATTDAMGNFTFKNITVSAANGHVVVVKAGYFKGIRSFVTAAGKNNFVKIQLIKQTLTGTIAAASGGTVNSNGAVISFPANAFVTASGAAYSGSVKIFAAWIDPTSPILLLTMPGDLRGIDSSNREYILKSYGMVGAELQDASGNALKLAPGKTATISFPIPATLQADAPATVPLWHFDETTARWKQEGTATRTGNTYSATVDKFSFWNVDVPSNFVMMDARVINNANNLPLANVMVKITSLVNNTYGVAYTNDSGYVSGYVPKNQALKLEVIANLSCNPVTLLHSQNIGPYSVNVSLGNINVTVPTMQVVSFTGTVKNCSNQAVTNGYVSMSLANGVSTVAYTNASGQVSFSLIYCGGNVAYSYNAVDLGTGNASSLVSGVTTGNTANLGTITACGNTINTNGVYIAGNIENDAVLWKDGIATHLTNNSPSGNKYAYAVKTLVYNNDVYVMGNEQDSIASGWISTLKLWKNGAVTNLTNGTTDAEGFGMDVYNGDVYIVGTEYSGTQSVAKMWKNGVVTVLNKDSFDYIDPSDVKVINGDVYISGHAVKLANGGPALGRAVYWKNGILNLLSTVNSGAGSIFINNTDIYVTGYETPTGQNVSTGVYWKNGVKTALTFPAPNTIARPSSIFVDNNDIYVGGVVSNGNNSTTNLCYWKNNTISVLTNYATNNYVELNGIFVKNNIVYTAGDYYVSGIGVSKPLYFQNNIPVALTGYTANDDVSAFGVFVK